MTTEDFAAKCLKVKEVFREGGVSLTTWAKSRGFKPRVVHNLLDGRTSGNWGQAREVAEALGLIYPTPGKRSNSDPRLDRKGPRRPKEVLAVSWKRVGKAIDLLATQGLTPRVFAHANGFKWESIRPIFEECYTPKSGSGKKVVEMFDLLDRPEMAQHVYPLKPKQSSERYLLRWPGSLQAWLESDAAPECLSREEIHEMARASWRILDRGWSVSEQSISNWVHQKVSEGVLKHVGRLYVNTLARTDSPGFGVANKLKSSAVVSLWSVLIRHGVMEGAQEEISCVIEAVPGVKAARIMTMDGFETFRFYELDQALLKQTLRQGSDALDRKFHFPVATPERALMDWFAVRKRGDTWVPLPPMTLHLEKLDWHKLDRVAIAMGLVGELNEWIERRNSFERSRGRNDALYRQVDVRVSSALLHHMNEASTEISKSTKDDLPSTDQTEDEFESRQEGWEKDAWPD